MSNKTVLKKDLMVRILEEEYGNVKTSALRTGISRKTHYDWLKNDIKYQHIVRKITIKETGIDLYSKRDQTVRNKETQEKHKLNWGDKKYIYIVNQENTQYYKIGVSKIKPHLRLLQIQTGNPNRVNMIYMCESDTPYENEKLIHKELSAHRIRGEWFKFTQKTLNKAINLIKQTVEKNNQLRLFMN